MNTLKGFDGTIFWETYLPTWGVPKPVEEPGVDRIKKANDKHEAIVIGGHCEKGQHFGYMLQSDDLTRERRS